MATTNFLLSLLNTPDLGDYALSFSALPDITRLSRVNHAAREAIGNSQLLWEATVEKHNEAVDEERVAEAFLALLHHPHVLQENRLQLSLDAFMTRCSTIGEPAGGEINRWPFSLPSQIRGIAPLVTVLRRTESRPKRERVDLCCRYLVKRHLQEAWPSLVCYTLDQLIHFGTKDIHNLLVEFLDQRVKGQLEDSCPLLVHERLGCYLKTTFKTHWFGEEGKFRSFYVSVPSLLIGAVLKGVRSIRQQHPGIPLVLEFEAKIPFGDEYLLPLIKALVEEGVFVRTQTSMYSSRYEWHCIPPSLEASSDLVLQAWGWPYVKESSSPSER